MSERKNPFVTAKSGKIEGKFENGIVPEGLIGSHIEGGKVVRTRPLYPYPEAAVYTGSGSIDDAASFTSSANFTCSVCNK